MLSALVVDDHPAQRLFLSRMLEGEGHAVRCAPDGHEALVALAGAIPDMLFVDWMMPGVDGLEIVRSLRRIPGGERCYVVMLTSKTAPEDLATAFDVGVDDYMGKPVGALELRARMKSAIRLAMLYRDLTDKVTEAGKLNEELIELNGRLETLASTDGLTGLPNRRTAARRLGEAWAASARYDHPLSVAIVDIDHFKRVNDEFGHSRGDAAIRHVASVLADHARASDLVARFGGEEFVWILPHTSASDALVCLDRARRCIERACCQADGREVRLSISAGIAERTGEVENAEQLLRAADEALYAAKNSGRNRVCISGQPAVQLAQAA